MEEPRSLLCIRFRDMTRDAWKEVRAISGRRVGLRLGASISHVDTERPRAMWRSNLQGGAAEQSYGAHIDLSHVGCFLRGHVGAMLGGGFSYVEYARIYRGRCSASPYVFGGLEISMRRPGSPPR